MNPSLSKIAKPSMRVSSLQRWREIASSSANCSSRSKSEQQQPSSSAEPQHLSDLWASFGSPELTAAGSSQGETSSAYHNWFGVIPGSVSMESSGIASSALTSSVPRSSMEMSGANPGFECEVCGKQFMIKYYYMRHMMSHQEKRFQCPYCPTKVSYKWNLKSHISKRHKDKPPLY